MYETSWKEVKKFGDFEITIERALFFKDENKKYIVMGDLHIGIENALRRKGILLPKLQIRIIKQYLQKLKKRYGSNVTVIINGDIKHEFGELTYQEREEITLLMKYIIERFENVVLIKGNHDNFVINTLKNKGIQIYDYYSTKNFYITHGHKKVEINRINKNIILSHEHPAIRIIDDIGGYKRIDTFLIHKYNDKYIILLPSPNIFSQGLDFLRVDKRDITNPTLSQLDIDNFKVYGISDPTQEILYFGTLGKLKKVIISKH